MIVLLMSAAFAAAPLDCAGLAVELAAIDKPVARVSRVAALASEHGSDPVASGALGRVLLALQDPATVADSPDVLRARLLAACAIEEVPRPVSVDPEVRMGSALEATTNPPPEARTGPTPETLRAYERRHLSRGTVNRSGVTYASSIGSTVGTTYVPVAYSYTSWTVYDGGGRPLGIQDFIAQVGDEAGSVRLERKVADLRNLGIGLTVGGALIGLVGGIALANKDDDDIVLRVLTGTGSLGLVSSGIALTIVAPTRRKTTPIPSIYSVDEVDRLIERHNDGLRSELKLTEEDTREIDLR